MPDGLKTIKEPLLRQLYPFGSDADYSKLYVSVSLTQLHSEMENVKKFDSLGFQVFTVQDSVVQCSIRLNKTPFCTQFNSVIDLFECLAAKIDNEKLLKLLDKCILRHFHDNPIDIPIIKIQDSSLILTLNEKYSGYVPNCRIQKLLMLSESTKQKNYSTIRNRVIYASSLDFGSFPPNFFNLYVLDNVFYGDLQNNFTKRVSFEGIKFLFSLYKLIGDENLSLIKDTDIQFKTILSIDDDHEQRMQRCQEIVKNLINVLTEIEIYNATDGYILDVNVMKNIIMNYDLDYAKGLAYLKDLKELFPQAKLCKRAIWTAFSPVLFDAKSQVDSGIVHGNIEFFIDMVKTTAVLYNCIIIDEIILKEHAIEVTPFKFLLELYRKQCNELARRDLSEQNFSSKFLQSMSKLKLATSFSMTNLPISKPPKTESKLSPVLDNPKLDLYTSEISLTETHVSKMHHIIDIKGNKLAEDVKRLESQSDEKSFRILGSEFASCHLISLVLVIFLIVSIPLTFYIFE